MDDNYISNFAIVSWAVIFCLGLASVLIWKGTPDHDRIRAEYVAKNRCEHVGFYGRSGDRKVYNCRGLLIKEEDISTRGY